MFPKTDHAPPLGGEEWLATVGFEKMVGDDQRLDRLARITAARRDGLIRCRL
jgi:hypothetical protein